MSPHSRNTVPFQRRTSASTGFGGALPRDLSARLYQPTASLGAPVCSALRPRAMNAWASASSAAIPFCQFWVMSGSSELVEQLANRVPGRNQVAREMADREGKLLADRVGFPRTGLLDSYVRPGRADVSGRQ